MYYPILLPFLGLILAFPPPAASASESIYQFQVEPHVYSGTRGNEPRGQTVVQTYADLKDTDWNISAHWESELLGRRDLSFDIDRAWIQSSSTLTWGRIHPWDISLHPDRARPWGYLAQDQSQNRGILLGSGFSDDIFPRPMIMGWIGGHFWSDPTHNQPFQVGLSASPIFVPTLGSESDLSEEAPASVGRFGRRPPGFVEVNGNLFPLRYRIDQSQILRDVILQPQMMAQAYWKYGSIDSYPQAWFFVSRAPSPDPSPEATGFLKITQTDITGVAEVTPRFPERWLASLNHRWILPQYFYNLSLFNSLQLKERGTWGYEFGLGGTYFSISIADEFRTPSGTIQFPQNASGNYIDLLAQIDAQVPLVSHIDVYGGLKSQLRQEDSLWLRSGFKWAITPSTALQLGMDLFHGADGTYFGEWRTNNRVYTQLRWWIFS